MKKIAAVFLFLFLTTICCAQNIKESYKIYDMLFTIYNHVYSTRLDKVTTFRGLKHFNFKDPSIHLTNNRDTLNNDWREFLTSIDTASLILEPLSDSYLRKHPGKATDTRYLRFSPVIFLGNKAICSAFVFGAGGYTGEVYLFEKKAKKWALFKAYAP